MNTEVFETFQSTDIESVVIGNEQCQSINPQECTSIKTETTVESEDDNAELSLLGRETKFNGDTPSVRSSILNELLDQLNAVDFYVLAELAQGETLEAYHYLVISIEEILRVAKQNSWGLAVTDGNVYVYDGTYWSVLTKKEVASFLAKAAEKLGVDKFEARFYGFNEKLVKQFYSSSFLDKPKGNSEEVLINLQNGTYVITPTHQVIKPFSSADFLTYRLTFDFDPAATAPNFHQYLNRVLPDPSQQLVLAEYVASIFVKQSTLKLEKSLILYGTGANGKSVFFDIIRAMLGTENVSNYSLQSLTNDNGYFRAKIGDKLLNYASEISPKMDSTLFKQMVSGEPVEARLPYGEPFLLKDYAKFIFNTNELPRDGEQNEAFFRRFLIIHFGVTIPAVEQDPTLAQRIVQHELSGVFNWVLAGLGRLLRQQRFSPSAAIDNSLEEYRLQSDTVYLFLSEEGYVVDNSAEMSLKELYDRYKDFCKESGYKACSSKIYGNRLRGRGFDLVRKSSGNVVNARKEGFREAAEAAQAA